jgi:hypothetical protein
VILNENNPINISLNISKNSVKPIWLAYGVLCHFQQYFSYIVVVSFIGGGNQSTQKKPPT